MYCSSISVALWPYWTLWSSIVDNTLRRDPQGICFSGAIINPVTHSYIGLLALRFGLGNPSRLWPGGPPFWRNDLSLSQRHSLTCNPPGVPVGGIPIPLKYDREKPDILCSLHAFRKNVLQIKSGVDDSLARTFRLGFRIEESDIDTNSAVWEGVHE